MADVLMLVADVRERNGELLKRLETLGVDVRIAMLSVGDYIVSDRVAIERKAMPDFERSIITGRLFEQAARLKEHYATPILILEGDRKRSRLDGRAIAGAIASLYIEYGVQVMQTLGPADTAETIASLARHEQRTERRAPSLKGGAKAYTDRQHQLRIIGNLPGVGPKLAEALLSHFGSIDRIVSADASALRLVQGIGPKRAACIRRVLNAPYADAASAE